MPVIAFMNMKGGVGKTTLCVQIAGHASSEDKRVLVIDMDPQFNATQHLVTPKAYFEDKEGKRTVLAILDPIRTESWSFGMEIAPASQKPPAVQELTRNIWQVADSPGLLDLLAGSDSLAYLLVTPPSESQRGRYAAKRFGEFIEAARRSHDYIFLDCQPSASMLSEMCISHADLVVVPVVPNAYSLRGIVLMSDFIDYVAKIRGRKPAMAIALNCMSRGMLSDGIVKSIEESPFGGKLLRTRIGRSKLLHDAPRREGPIFKRMAMWSGKPYSGKVSAQIALLYSELEVLCGPTK